jgi:electron transport complex protein RnfG
MSEKEKISQPEGPKVKSIAMLRTLSGVAAFSGLLIVLTYQFTFSTIKENKAVALKKAIFDVLKGTKHIKNFYIKNRNLVEKKQEKEKGLALYACYNSSKKLLGLAIQASGQGFQEKIKILYGYSFEKEAVIGMKVLESKETPGLGDKIEKDPNFLKNFEELDVRLTDDRTNLKKSIEVVKTGKKTEKHQIDGITGATISSKAIGKIINDSTKELLPIIWKNIDKIKVSS